MSFVVVGYAIASLGDCALAQVTPDGTLGAESSVVTPQAPGSPVDVISGGATRGVNLFHSFEQFSIPTGGEAFFNNALDIQNIISRVTGSSISNIDGLIRANGTANLFLLNPNGIAFGSNASLNIGGSFVGSTASSLNFADGTQFSATAPQTTPLLTVSVPIGLQLGGSAGSILNQSQATNSSGQVVGLQVQPGKTLALVGGLVRLDGGNLQPRGGRVELGGLAEAGTVGINVNGNDLRLSFPDGVARADLSLTNGAEVNVRASGGGSIAINAQNLNLAGGSSLLAGIDSGLGSISSVAGDIEINATGSINLTNDSDIANWVLPTAVGNAGGINITTGSLSVMNGTRVSASTRGRGDAGSVNINARDRVSFDGEGSNGRSGAYSFVQPTAVGNGGSVNITAGSLSVTNGARLAASTRGQGNAGSVTINARETVSFDSSEISASVESKEAVGNGGNINITAGSLSVTKGANLSASTRGQGNAGSVNINVRDRVSFDGVNSRAASAVLFGSVGNGGSVNITAGSLSVTNGAALAASTFGQGNAGSVTINARETVSFDSSEIRARVGSKEAVGNGGNINITAGSLSVTKGADLSASTFGQGNAGSVNINVRDRVSFDGVNSRAASAVLFGSVGNGGSVNITAGSLSVTNGARLAARSEGIGVAGNIEVSASSIRLDNKAVLSSNTTAGRGNIFLRSEDLVLRRGSNITTNATGTATGGNINIDAGVIAGLENSDISANSTNSFGGRVTINAQGIFGTEFRNRLTPESDITATGGRPELSGTVEINNPDVDPSQGLIELSAELVDVSNQIATDCPASVRRGESKFIITGRGGLPPNPREPLNGDNVLTEWNTLDSDTENRSSTTPSTNSTKENTPTQIVEANGWTINDKGDVVLTATAPSATLDIPWMPKSGCNAPEPES